MRRVGDHVKPVRSCLSAFARQPPGCDVAWSRPVAPTVQFDTSRLPASARCPHRPRFQTASPFGGVFMKRWPNSRAGSTRKRKARSYLVRLQRLRLSCRSGARLIPILAMRHGQARPGHAYRSTDILNFTLNVAGHAKKGEVEGEIKSQIEYQEVQEGEASSAAQAAEN